MSSEYVIILTVKKERSSKMQLIRLDKSKILKEFGSMQKFYESKNISRQVIYSYQKLGIGLETAVKRDILKYTNFKTLAFELLEKSGI